MIFALKKCRLRLSRLALAALLSLAVLGYTSPMKNAQAATDVTLEAQSLMRDVLERVRVFYIAPVDPADLVQTGLQSMLATLDAESGYLPPGTPALKNMDSVGEIPELGLTVTYADGMLVVVAPSDYGPAKEAGIRPKDRLYALGRTPLMVTSLFDGAAQLRRALSDLNALKSENETQFLSPTGSKTQDKTLGKTLSFIVQHADQTVETIAIPPNFEAGKSGKELGPAVSISWQNANESQDANSKEKIAIIRLARLPSDAATQIENKIANLGQNKNGQKMSGVILDLRRSAGGDFNAALASANLFLDAGILAKIKQNDVTKTPDSKDGKASNKDKKAANLEVKILTADAKRQSKFLAAPLPVVVLIDEGTADAAETLAAALQGNKRAILVGAKSFGRATLRSQISLSNGGTMILATGRYLTPSGAVIEKAGLTPDILIRNPLPENANAQAAGPGTLLKKDNKPAPTLPKPTNEGKIAGNNSRGEAKPRDLQMERAIDIVTGMALYRGQTAQ